MAERCQYCGEEAVIEESIDGGKEQKICIECGSLAADQGGNSPTVQTLAGPACFALSGDEFDADDMTDESIPDRGQFSLSLPSSSSIVCNSCGISLDSDNLESGRASSENHHLCAECFTQDQMERREDDEGGRARGTMDTSSFSSSPSVVNENSAPDCITTVVNTNNSNEVSKSCLSCGSVNLSVDALHGDERLVCTDCGRVCSNADLVTNTEHTSSSQYHSTTLPCFAKGRKIQRGLADGLDSISNLCSTFYFTPTIKVEAENMFRAVYLTRSVRGKTVRMKECLAAVCLFIVCRQNDLPICLKHFERHVESFLLFIRAKKFVTKSLNIALPNVNSMTRLSASLLQHLRLGSGFMDKVKDILFLFRKAWLVQGRSRPGLISLAAYYAFISSDRYNKKFISWRQFCVKNKLALVPRQLFTDCYNFLCKLAGSLPWLNSKQVITHKTLPLYINSILEYRESLFHLVFKSDDELEETRVQSCPSDSEQVMNCSKRKNDDIGASQKVLLLPSKCKKQRRDNDFPQQDIYVPIPSGVDLDCPILKEDEFEEEINSYILSAEERERVREDKLSIMTVR